MVAAAPINPVQRFSPRVAGSRPPPLAGAALRSSAGRAGGGRGAGGRRVARSGHLDLLPLNVELAGAGGDVCALQNQHP